MIRYRNSDTFLLLNKFPESRFVIQTCDLVKIGNMNCSSRKQLSDNSFSNKRSKHSTASRNFFLSKFSENIFSVKKMTSLVKLKASCSDELIVLQQLCKVDWDSQKWVEGKKEGRKC